VFNLDTGVASILADGPCAVQDGEGNCYIIGTPSIFHWNNQGTQIIFHAWSDTADSRAIGVLQFENGIWQPPRLVLLVGPPHYLVFFGVSSSGQFGYRYHEPYTNKQGKTNWAAEYTVILDPALCEHSECLPADGIRLPINFTGLGSWTRSGGLVYSDLQGGGGATIREYSNPYTGTVSALSIPNVDFYEVDTTY
jgi:hypothetical protein